MRDKKQILLIGLGVAAVMSLAYGILTPAPSRARRESSSKSVPVAKESAMMVKRLIPVERYAKKGNFPTWGKNPFSPKEAPAVPRSFSDLVLNGIAWGPKNPSALINDQVVFVGDKIEGSKVVAINRNNVILNNGEKDFKLEWGSGPSEKSVKNSKSKTQTSD